MDKPVFVFDFDGTIADSHHYIIEIANGMAADFNFTPIDWDELEELKDKTSQEVIKHLKVPVMKIPAILARAKREFQEGISCLEPFQGIAELLQQLQDFGIKMGILSSNSKENVVKFLENHGLEDMFSFIHTTSKVWSKNTTLKKVIKMNGLVNDQVLYIGDETRDIDAAQRLGVKVAAVTWGYNSSRALKAKSPDYLVERPSDLLDMCSKNQP